MRKETSGARLRRLRGLKGMSQRDVADKCERVSYAYISRIEAGARTPSVRAIREMAAALGVPAFYLEHGLELPEGLYSAALDDGSIGIFDAQDHPWLTVWPAGDGDPPQWQESIIEAVSEALAVVRHD